MDFSDEEECEDSGNISYEEDNDEVEDDGFVDENDEKTNETTNSTTTTEDLFPFTVLPTEAIVQHMTDSIRDANSVLQLPATTMRILLNHFGWDKEKLMEVYYGTDQEELFRKVHLINPNSSAAAPAPTQSSNSSSNSSLVPADNSECGICCLQIPASRMYVMKCGHRFCGPCWNEYLTFKIMEESMGQTIACAAHNCPILMDDAAVMKLLTDPQVKLKYQHHITYSFVHCNRLMRWCPSPDCKNAVRVQYNKWQQVACHCNYKFCFQCGDSWHDPVKCSWLKKWIKKCNDDSETSHWISANTKDCPKCNAIIEKNGGCNHMTCTNVNCKQEFCWVCLGQWESYAHNCNRYNETDIKAAKDAKEKSRAALERYLFYCNRYMNHMQSLKFENKLYDAVNEKMEEIQQHMSWIEAQFLKKAVDILCQCRQTLMYTYVFAFYVVKSNQSAIFEDNQQDLESTTEKLSEFLERDITSESITEIKQKVQNIFRYCETRRKVLIDHVHEGYDQDWWTYNDC